MNNFVFSTLLFCLIATAIVSSMNLLPVFNYTSHGRGEEGERVLLQQYRLHRVHTVIFCGWY